MNPGSLLLVNVGDLIEATIADEAAVGEGQLGLLAHYGGLHLQHLGDITICVNKC